MRSPLCFPDINLALIHYITVLLPRRAKFSNTQLLQIHFCYCYYHYYLLHSADRVRMLLLGARHVRSFILTRKFVTAFRKSWRLANVCGCVFDPI